MATRLVWALTAKSAGTTPALPSVPRIFRLSRSIFSSSLPMYGTTFPRISSEGTPGYPAPETACIVETNSFSIPKARCSGTRARTSAAVEQLGLARMAPDHPRPSRWRSISAR